MGKYFVVSLCKNGLIGGGITAEEDAITYHTGKVTVPKEIRRLVMKYEDIEGLTLGWLLFLPTVPVKLRGGEEYKFVVFGRNRFVSTLVEMGVKVYIKTRPMSDHRSGSIFYQPRSGTSVNSMMLPSQESVSKTMISFSPDFSTGAGQ